VIAFPEGAAAEIVIDGENGTLVDNEREMALAVKRIGLIDPNRCRASVAERYDVSAVAAAYEAVYCTTIETDPGHELAIPQVNELPLAQDPVTIRRQHR
jgi:glycosyltransferase involved in cell wall biosynthesis